MTLWFDVKSLLSTGGFLSGRGSLRKEGVELNVILGNNQVRSEDTCYSALPYIHERHVISTNGESLEQLRDILSIVLVSHRKRQKELRSG